jgi:integrase/recombinase XerD
MNNLVTHRPALIIPRMIQDVGANAEFAWNTFFGATYRNPHTRAAYRRSVLRYLAWAEERRIPVRQTTPADIGEYLDGLRHLAAPTKKLELAALRAFFDELCLRHVVPFNPAAAVRGDKHRVLEGATPEITPTEARQLLNSISTETLAGKRDRAVIACLVFTAARAGAVARLTRDSLIHQGSQYVLRFIEKGGLRREIPVRNDLYHDLFDYLDAAGLRDAAGLSPLFRTLNSDKRTVTANALSGVDICRLVKRRAAAAGLSQDLSPHSFRVCAVTDLLSQGHSLEDVQPCCL